MISSNPYDKSIHQSLHIYSILALYLIYLTQRRISQIIFIIKIVIEKQAILFQGVLKYILFYKLSIEIQKMINKVFIVFMCILVCWSYSNTQRIARRQLQNFSLNARTKTVYQRCPTPRIQFYNSQKNQSSSNSRRQTAEAIGLNGDELIRGLLLGNSSLAQKQVNKSISGLTIYFIFMLIGLAILILIGPFLICCVCCPYKCPPCTSCRNEPFELYSKCQMKWPSVVVIILSIVVLGTAIAILIVNGSLQKGYSQTRCSIAILFDDILNGNTTRDGQGYWMGLKPLRFSFTNILASTQQADNGDLKQYTINQIKQIKNDISNIPRGDDSGQKLQLSYITPINSSQGTQTVQSTINELLGSKQQQTSLIGSSYALLSQAQNALSSGLWKVGQNVIDTLFRRYAGLVYSVQDTDERTDNGLTTAQDVAISPITTVVYVFAILAIIVSLVLIIASICICCNKFSARMAVYPSCVIVWIVGVLFFILSLVTSASTIGVHYACRYVEVGLLTKAQFKYRFNPIFDNPLLTSMISQCATKQGSGILIDSTTFPNLTNTQQSQNPINIEQIASLLTRSKNNLTQVIKSYQHAEIYDIDSKRDLQILLKVADYREYSCNSGGFVDDIWIPSVNQRLVYVPCGRQDACIDTYNILQQYSNKQQVFNSLKTKYPSQQCITFNQQLTNIWNNFYRKKKQVLGPVSQRAKAASQKIDHLTNTLQQNLTPVRQSNNNISRLDCKVLGEDAQLIVDTFCTSMRILSIIISFALLLLIIFVSVLAVRAYKSYFRRRDDIQQIPVQSAGNGFPIYKPGSQVQLTNNYNTGNRGTIGNPKYDF